MPASILSPSVRKIRIGIYLGVVKSVTRDRSTADRNSWLLQVLGDDIIIDNETYQKASLVKTRNGVVLCPASRRLWLSANQRVIAGRRETTICTDGCCIRISWFFDPRQCRRLASRWKPHPGFARQSFNETTKSMQWMGEAYYYFIEGSVAPVSAEDAGPASHHKCCAFPKS